MFPIDTCYDFSSSFCKVPLYWYEGFLSVQSSIDAAVIEVWPWWKTWFLSKVIHELCLKKQTTTTTKTPCGITVSCCWLRDWKPISGLRSWNLLCCQTFFPFVICKFIEKFKVKWMKIPLPESLSLRFCFYHIGPLWKINVKCLVCLVWTKLYFPVINSSIHHEKIIISKYGTYRTVKLLPFSYAIIALQLLLYSSSICFVGPACSFSSNATLVFITKRY